MDGQTIDGTKYKRLVDYLGTTTLPNLNGRYLRADSTPGQMVEAGLPNITGTTNIRAHGWESDNPIGALKGISRGNLQMGGSNSASVFDVDIDASRSSTIYGKSDTVTPLTYTVRAFICYA